MGWVRRQPDIRAHQCASPKLGQLGDLYRCDDCRKLWRLAPACDLCEMYGYHDSGQCTVGLAWRPATFWQRFRYR